MNQEKSWLDFWSITLKTPERLNIQLNLRSHRVTSGFGAQRKWLSTGQRSSKS